MAEAAVSIIDRAPSNAMTPMDMLDRAVSGGASIEVLEKLMALQERWEKNNGRRAFDDALANAKAEIPVILKNRTVDFTSSKGRTNYRHEDLAEIARTVDPILAKHGLSYRFRTDTPPGGPVIVTCVLSHRGGHAEENTLSAGRDESGNKNSIQAVGSTITYLQRYSLKAALGLAASDDDDAEAGDPEAKITGEQREELEALIAETGADVVKFCGFLKVESLADIPLRDFGKATAALQAKRRKA